MASFPAFRQLFIAGPPSVARNHWLAIASVRQNWRPPGGFQIRRHSWAGTPVAGSGGISADARRTAPGDGDVAAARC